jgi:hypothetical protein
VRSRVEEDEAGVVDRPDRVDVHLRVKGAPERVRGEDVQAPVLHDRGRACDRVEDMLNARPDPLLRRAATGSGRRARRPCEVEEVRTLGLVELKGTGQRLQNAFGDPAQVPALEADVVVDADSG